MTGLLLSVCLAVGRMSMSMSTSTLCASARFPASSGSLPTANFPLSFWSPSGTLAELASAEESTCTPPSASTPRGVAISSLKAGDTCCVPDGPAALTSTVRDGSAAAGAASAFGAASWRPLPLTVQYTVGRLTMRAKGSSVRTSPLSFSRLCISSSRAPAISPILRSNSLLRMLMSLMRKDAASRFSSTCLVISIVSFNFANSPTRRVTSTSSPSSFAFWSSFSSLILREASEPRCTTRVFLWSTTNRLTSSSVYSYLL
mmetsp:Transcript_42751/g.100204  ORF Transcript_42751/g.100204 Transcript_42751/m.100204 type:complete len:259 (-) Transcript_42751:2007-2783(-)